MASFADVANIAQLTGIDAVSLISMIVKAAATARMHKKNCRQFAQHLKLIGNLLEQLKITELKRYPETREPLEHLEDALRRSYILVNSCQDRSYLYLLAMGWNIVYQFRRAQNEIDQYLKIIPLITLVDNARVRERLEYIEMDQREYTLEVEDMKMQEVIMKPEPSKDDTIILTKNLSCSYPRVPINEAIQKENEKLQLELQHSQANLDVGQCEFIQHLLDVTEVVATNTLSLRNSHENAPKFTFNTEEPNRLLAQYFEGQSKITKRQFVQSFKDKVWGQNDDDAVKFANLYFLHNFIMSEEPSLTKIYRKDFDFAESGHFVDYPWGNKAFGELINNLHSKITLTGKYFGTHGFPLAMQIWLYECCFEVNPDIAKKMSNNIPRILNWETLIDQPWCDYLINDLFRIDRKRLIQGIMHRNHRALTSNLKHMFSLPTWSCSAIEKEPVQLSPRLR